MSLIGWPYWLLQPRNINVTLVPRILSGGQSLTGIVQEVDTTGGGYWMIELSGIACWTPDQNRTWRAIDWRLKGSGRVQVPVYDIKQAPYLAGLPPGTLPEIPHSDGAFFSDTTGYVTGAITAEAALGASLGATAMRIRITNGSELRGGEYFSIDHGEPWGIRLYGIRSVSIAGAQLYDVKFEPPLRQPVPEEATIIFDFPSCRMVLAPGERMGDPRAIEPMTLRNVRFAESFP